MKPSEEPQEPYEFRASFRDIPYQDLPPNIRRTVDAAFEALGDETPLTQFQTFMSTNAGDFRQGQNFGRQEQYWVKWEYSFEEWQQFDRLDWGRARNRLVVIATLSVLVWLCLFLFIAANFSVSGTDVLVLGEMFALIFLLPTFLFTFAFAGRQFWEARKRHQVRRGDGPHRITIGTPSTFRDQGLWIAGSFVPIQETFLKLNNIKLTENPPLLHLRRKHIMIRQSSWYDTIHVLVPRGHEAEAVQLVERFRAETIAPSQKSYTPPEP